MISRIYFSILGIILILPISVDGISANYLYALLPVLQLPLCAHFSCIRFRVISYALALLWVFGGILSISLILAFVHSENPELIAIGSFFFFVTYIYPLILKITTKALDSLILGVVIFSLFYSLNSIFAYLLGGVYSSEAKDLVGSQRVGFVINFALFYLLSARINPTLKRFPMSKMGSLYCSLMMTILAIGSLLTFSRASLISLIVTILFALLFYSRVIFKNLLIFNPKYLLLSLASALLLLALCLFQPFDSLMTFYGERLFSGYLGDPDALASDLSNESSSGGTRLSIFKYVFQLLLSNPFLGNSFNGISRVTSFGSLHNQYVDILVRAGLILGTMVIITLLVIFLRSMRAPAGSYQRITLLPFVATIVYGFFHETFRESQGAVLYLIFVQSYFMPFSAPNNS